MNENSLVLLKLLLIILPIFILWLTLSSFLCSWVEVSDQFYNSENSEMYVIYYNIFSKCTITIATEDNPHMDCKNYPNQSHILPPKWLGKCLNLIISASAALVAALILVILSFYCQNKNGLLRLFCMLIPILTLSAEILTIVAVSYNSNEAANIRYQEGTSLIFSLTWFMSIFAVFNVFMLCTCCGCCGVSGGRGNSTSTSNLGGKLIDAIIRP